MSIASPISPVIISPSILAAHSYTIVIPQQGALQATFATPPQRFSATVSLNSQAIVVRASTSVPFVFETIKLKVVMSDGTVLSPSFALQAGTDSVGAPTVPNIINESFVSVSTGQIWNYRIISDITDVPCTFDALNLPAGLAINKTIGQITGTAPSTPGIYLIKFIAINGLARYTRYFVLGVGASGGTTPGTPLTIGLLPQNVAGLGRVLFDGNYFEAQIAGPPEFEIPFATDPKPYAYKIEYWQDFRAPFTEPPIGDPGPLGGGYAGGSPGTFKSVGGGIVAFKREYVTVPNSRSEYESHSYNYQFYFPLIGRTGTAELPITTMSRIQFDYFQTDTPEQDIDLPRAPVMFTPGAVFFLNDFLSAAASPTGAEVLAEDATLKEWKKGIFERKMRFIRWISMGDILFA